MNTKIYNSPEFSVIEAMDSDIITTSDPTLGTETPTIPDNSGSWEAL